MEHSKADIAQWLIETIAQYLNEPPSSVQADAAFESFAIESVVLFQITGDLADWMGRELDASLIWDHPNIDSLSSFLAGKQDKQELLPAHVIHFNNRGNLCPLFFVSGLGGHPRRFTSLANGIDSRRPTYGLKIPGFGGDTPRVDKLESVASTLIHELRAVQPTGPYQLLGYSFGGLVAYEMAIQLNQQEERSVGFLGILDTAAPGAMTQRPWWQRFVIRLRQYVTHASVTNKEHNESRHKKNSAVTDPNAGAMTLIEQTMNWNQRLQQDYRPGHWPLDLVLFSAMRCEPENEFLRIEPLYGWPRLVNGTVNCVMVPGTHLTMLEGDNAQTLAQSVEPWLVD